MRWRNIKGLQVASLQMARARNGLANRSGALGSWADETSRIGTISDKSLIEMRRWLPVEIAQKIPTMACADAG